MLRECIEVVQDFEEWQKCIFLQFEWYRECMNFHPSQSVELWDGFLLEEGVDVCV